MAYVIIAVCFGLAGGLVGKVKGSSFLLWFLINYTLFGLRPEWWHLTTVGIHLTVTLLFYLITVRLAREVSMSWTEIATA